MYKPNTATKIAMCHLRIPMRYIGSTSFATLATVSLWAGRITT
jgi:hypothetical protein